MKYQKFLRNQEGFTLVEIIAVLIILGFLTVVAVPRYIDLEQNAKQRGFDVAISELNGRESLAWTKFKISTSGYIDDAQIRNPLNGVSYYLGGDYTWNPGDPQPSGGTLEFKGESVTLIRASSDDSRPAVWSRF